MQNVYRIPFLKDRGCYDRVSVYISSTVSTATEFSSDNGVQNAFVSHLHNNESK